MNITIGIDGNEANVEKRVGISEYSFELLKKFHEFSIPTIQFRVYLKDKPLIHMPKARNGWEYKIIKPARFWTQFGLPFGLFLHKPRPDTFFTPAHYAPRFSPVSTVISIMDLSFLYFPELFAKKDLFQLIHWTRYSVKNASKIFTISNASRDDIIKQYNIKKENIVVTYPGIKPVMINKKAHVGMKDLKDNFSINTKYILFVGTLQPRKNITRLIEAFSRIKKQDIQLVIVGKRGWLFEEILQAPQVFGISDKVKFLDFVTNEQLPSLYTNALCFVLPSLYEGFGLPILEAMQYGCPVITSNVSSLPEAGGNAAVYIDPENVEDIKNKMELVINDSELRKDMIVKGYKHIKKFSWEKTARETLAVLQDVASKK